MKYAVCAVIIKDDLILATHRRHNADDWGLPGGNKGTSTSGDFGTSTSGVSGIATSGAKGTIIIKYINYNRYYSKVGHISEGGLEPNVAYKLDENHNFVKA